MDLYYSDAELRWCDTCLLTTHLHARLVELTPTGVTDVGTVSVCTRCHPAYSEDIP